MTTKNIEKIRTAVKKEYELAGKPIIDNCHLTEAKELINRIEGKYKFACNTTVYGILKELLQLEHPDRTDWDIIDMSKCPQNEYVDMYYPDGTLICHTNSDIEFNYVRGCIKDMGTSGFYLMFQGEKINIDKYGNIVGNWPRDMFNTFAETAMKLL